MTSFEPVAESLAPRPLDEPHPDRLTEDHPAREVVLAAHRAALVSGAPGYLDPVSGLWVMTAGYLADRGACCHTLCRHCPYVGA